MFLSKILEFFVYAKRKNEIILGTMQPFNYTNIAFISYKREDEEWAKWLQKKLEHYKLPTEIRKQNPDLEFAKNPRHVFKDTTDLSGGVLAKAIKEGLDSSKFLIVICSPRAAKSEWVCKEVQEFIDSGREEYIIPFIIDGEPYAKNPENECFPEALKALAGERELLGININENGRDSAAVKVVARLFDLMFDVLWKRFRREKRKKRIVTLFICLSIFIFASFGLHLIYENNNQRDELIKKEEAISKHEEEMKSKEDSILRQQEEINEAKGKATHFDYEGVNIDGNVDDFMSKLSTDGWKFISKEPGIYNIYHEERDLPAFIYYNKESRKVYAIMEVYQNVGSLGDVAYTFADDIYRVEPQEDMYGYSMEIDSVGLILFRENGDNITVKYVDRVNSYNYRAIGTY